MKGIKNITVQTSFHPRPEEESEDWFTSDYLEFDLAGNKVLEIIFGANGREIEKHILQYGSHNECVNELHYLDGQLNEVVEYYRDTQGLLLEAQHKFHDGAHSLIQFVRNEGSETIITRNEKGDEEGRVETRYNDQGQAMVAKTYNAAAQLSERQEFEYFENGALKLQKVYNGEGILNQQVSYDEEGKVLGEVFFSESGNISEQMVYSYREDGQVDRISGSRDFTQFTYEDDNQMIKEVNFGPNGSPERTCIRVYDSSGLLMESHEYASGEQYEMEPQVVARTLASYKSRRYSYIFYD